MNRVGDNLNNFWLSHQILAGALSSTTSEPALHDGIIISEKSFAMESAIPNRISVPPPDLIRLVSSAAGSKSGGGSRAPVFDPENRFCGWAVYMHCVLKN